MPSNSLACVAQAQHYQGVFAMNAVDPVIHCLQAVGRLPEDYSLGMPQCHVPCNPRSLMGREEEEGCVLKGLQTKRCVIISGKPGEGKTALAQKGVWDMWERGELPGGAYCVDLAGESGMSFLQRCPALQELYASGCSASFQLPFLHRGIRGAKQRGDVIQPHVKGTGRPTVVQHA